MAAKKSSLVENINRRKRAGTSRPKSKSTVSSEAYARMQQGWPGKKRKTKAKKARATKASARKTSSATKARRAKAPRRKMPRRKT